MSEGLSQLDLSQYDPSEIQRAAKIALYNQDLRLFCEKELKIVIKDVTGESDLQQFRPYRWQLDQIEAAEKQLARIGKIRQIVFKCRQPGESTMAAGIVSRLTYLTHNVHAFVVAQDKTTVGTIFGIYNNYYENLSDDIRPMQKYFTKGTRMVLGNPNMRARTDDPGLNSELIVGEAKNINVGTGFTVHALHLSELARYASVQSLKDSLIPAFSDGKNTIGIIESTAHWAAGAEMLKSMCERAMRGESEWEYHFVRWWRQPEFQISLEKGEIFKTTQEEKHLLKTVPLLTLENLKWRRRKLMDLDGDIYAFRISFPFTFEEAWIPGGHSAFPIDRLMELRGQIKPPKRRCEMTIDGKLYDDPDGRLLIWEEPEQGAEYHLGSDLGAGIDDEAHDATTAEIVKQGNRKQVAEWQGYIDARDFADVLFHLGMYYNVAQIAPETEKYGLGCVVRLQELCYPNIHIWQKRDQINVKYTNFLGWSTTNNSKILLVDLCRHLLWNRQLHIYSEALLEEMLNYVRDVTPGGFHTYNAGPGSTDDLIQAFMIALRISEDEAMWSQEGEMEFKQEKTEEKYRERDPAYYDVEGLRAIGVHTARSETKPW